MPQERLHNSEIREIIGRFSHIILRALRRENAEPHPQDIEVERGDQAETRGLTIDALTTESMRALRARIMDLERQRRREFPEIYDGPQDSEHFQYPQKRKPDFNISRVYTFVDALLPEEKEFLTRFFDTSYCVYGESLRRLEMYLLRNPEEIEVLLFLTDLTFRTWVDELAHPTEPRYFAGSLFNDFDDVLYFAKHKNRFTVMNAISASGLLTAHSIRLGPNNIVRFFLEYPGFIDLLMENGQIMFVSNDIPWSERLRVLEQVATILGTHGVGDKELSFALYSMWNPTVDHRNISIVLDAMTLRQREKLAETLGVNEFSPALICASCADNPRKIRELLFNHAGEIVYSVFRSGTSEEIKMSVRKMLRDLKEKFGATNRMSEAQRNEIDYSESRYHPLGDLRVAHGNEVEYQSTEGVGNAPLYVLDGYGWKRGDGGFGCDSEYSAGPFRSAKVAGLAMQRWIDANLFDIHASQNHTMHQNASVEDKNLYAQWVRLMRMTGYCWVPDTQNSNYIGVRWHNLRLVDQDGYVYSRGRIESKDFSFTRPEAYKRHLEIGVPLLSALSAYEKAVYFYTVKKTNRYFEDLSAVRLSEREIMSLPLSKEEKQLAKIWRRVLIQSTDAVTQIGCPKSIRRAVPVSQAITIAREVEKVYETVYDRTDVKKVQYETKKPVIQDGVRYPNIVAYSQNLLSTAALEVEKILEKAENKTLRMLARYDVMEDGEEKEEYGRSILQRCPWLYRDAKATFSTDIVHRILSPYVYHAKKFGKFERLSSETE